MALARVEGNTFRFFNIKVKRTNDAEGRTYFNFYLDGTPSSYKMSLEESAAMLAEFLTTPYQEPDKEITLKQSELDELKKKIAELESRAK